MIKLFRTRRSMAVAAGTAAIAAVVLLSATPAAMSAPQQRGAITTSARTPMCSASDLGVWVALDQAGVAAGTAYYPLEFTNLSKHTCTLYGFPGVSARASNGKQLGNPASRDHSVKARTVRLVPGATGYALLEYSDVVTGNCPKASTRTAAELQVYPPDQFQSDHAFWSLPACTARGSSTFLHVRVIAAGIGVRGDGG